MLCCPYLCMKCSLDISSFLEEISSLSYSVVSLYFFALFMEEVLLISPCYSLELCIQLGLIFPFAPFVSLHLLAIYRNLRRQPVCLLAFIFLQDGFGH